MRLGIDTSGAVSVAVCEEPGTDGTVRVRAVASDARARHHDEVLLGLIDQVLLEAGATRSDLTRIVAGRGPGPFTGLRVGLVVARTLAAALDVPLQGLCSLDALAHQAAADVIASADAPPVTIGVALDARRREVYTATYEAAPGRLVRTQEPAVDAPAEAAPALRACELLVGSGTALYPELLPATADLHHVDAGHLLQAAALAQAAGADLTSTEPLYLREPDAARPTTRKSALGR